MRSPPPQPPPPPPSAPPAPARPIGERWVLTGAAPIGRGSFADVWGGQDRETGEAVAVKALDLARLTPKLRAGLASEVAILRAARHAHVVSLLGVVEEPDRMFLVMEFCAGGDVAGLLRGAPGGRLGEPDARRLGGHLAAGLRRLWAAGCVHRDLKPHNLLLAVGGSDDGAEGGPGGRQKAALPLTGGLILKIADFGFARSLAPAALADTLCGSPLYMAPEVLRHGRYGASADLWSVGAILFELVAGRPPYAGASQAGLLAAIESHDGGVLPPDVVASPALISLLDGLLVADPASRLTFEAFFAHPWLAGAPGLREGGVDGSMAPPPAFWLPPPPPVASSLVPLLSTGGVRPIGITAARVGVGRALPSLAATTTTAQDEDGFVVVGGGGAAAAEPARSNRSAAVAIMGAPLRTAARLARRHSPQAEAPARLPPSPPLPPPPPPPASWPPGTPPADALVRSAEALDEAAAGAGSPGAALALRLGALAALAAVVRGGCPGAVDVPGARAAAAEAARAVGERAVGDAERARAEAVPTLPSAGSLAYAAALAAAREGAEAESGGGGGAAAAGVPYSRARALLGACGSVVALPTPHAAAAVELAAVVGARVAELCAGGGVGGAGGRALEV